MKLIQAALWLGNTVQVDFVQHSFHKKQGRLIRVELHNWTCYGLVKQPLCTVLFDGGLEYKFFPRHLVTVYDNEEKEATRSQ